MLGLGIILGLLAAFFQSLSYLATRHFVQPRAGEEGGGAGMEGGRSSRMMLVLAHLWMGAASLVALPAVWPRGHIPWDAVYLPLVMETGFYLLGQIGLVVALKYAEPSRVSPMLGFKLVVLALMVNFLTPQGLTTLQWAAAAVSVAGAMVLNYTGGKTPPRALAGIVVACVAYSISDWYIKALVEVMQKTTRDGAGMPIPRWQAFMLASFLCYALCGMVAVLFLPRLGSRRGRDWLGAMPFAGAWFVGMINLFACFGLVGVVFGNILQSSRGLMSVLMSSALAGWGLLHIEAGSPRKVFLRRVGAALLMVLAVILYVLGSRATP